MKKFLLGGTALVAMFAGSAMAADMPVRAPVLKAPPPIMAAYNWTGFYIGANGGYGWGDLSWQYFNPATGAPFPPPSTANHKTRGGLLGGTVGYNWQSGNWVFGLEADYDWADLKGSTPCPNPAFSCQSKLDSFGTGRGRIGWAVNQALFYGTGGVAFGNQKIRTVQLAGVGVPPTGTSINGSSNFAVGWTGGGGIEWGFMPGWSAKIEALYFDLGRDNYTVDFPATQAVTARHTGTIVRGGINYHF